MSCYITGTGAFLPGEPVGNDSLPEFLGELPDEAEVRAKILRMNGIKSRHYALDRNQQATHDVYGMAALAVEDCLANSDRPDSVSYLAAGSTNAPLVGPGIATILHSRLGERGLINESVEVCSNSGICTASAQSFVSAYRAVSSEAHSSALCVGAEHPSEILKSTFIKPPRDEEVMRKDLKRSKWFMSVFLRSMLSDGAGAFLLGREPATDRLSFRVNWTYSRSFAHEAPLCMKLESESLLLSQDVEILTEHMKPYVLRSAGEALEKHGDHLESYHVILPHLSSNIFRRVMKQTIAALCNGGRKIEQWTNLEWVGNTGAASIYIMLHEYANSHDLKDGEKVLLFVPESGQFNFVIISLTAVH